MLGEEAYSSFKLKALFEVTAEVEKNDLYNVIVEKNCLNKVEEYLNLKRKVLILTDSGIPKEYINKVLEKTKEGYVYEILQGESSKSFDNFGKILDYLIEKQFSRTDCIVALGGGVVGDLAGFVASTYMRGIDFYNIPTTLLSQVDSSIGGKTAIDKNGVKNIVGAFYPPKCVVIDPIVLKTLDKRQLHSGLVEALKMGITSDRTLVELIKDSNDLFFDIEEIIIKALNVKKHVVEEDPHEKHLRKILNFGHTIGHAIESSGKFNSLLHGECVALGMLYFSSDEVKVELINVLKKYNLPTSYGFDKNVGYKYITLDKKAVGEYINIIKCEKIGTFEICKVHKNDILKLLGGSNE